MNPPLRPVTDTEGLLAELQRRHIRYHRHRSCAACGIGEAGRDFETAAMGMSGLEVALPTMLALVAAGHFKLVDVITLAES